MAVVVYGKKPNHTLHLILTIVTCSIWGVVWIIMAIAMQERRTTLSIDEWGNIHRNAM